MKSRPNIRNRYVLLADVILVVVSVLGSYVLRLELGAAFSFYLPSAYWMIGTALVIKPLVYYYFRLYRRMWIYASVQELKLIVAAVSAASVMLSVVMVSFFNLGLFTGFPRSVLIIDWLISLILVGGLRFTIRLLSENFSQQSVTSPNGKSKKALIMVLVMLEPWLFENCRRIRKSTLFQSDFSMTTRLNINNRFMVFQ